MKTPRLIVLASLYVVLGGCAVGKLVGGMAQNFEYQKIKEVHAAYAGLENHSVAVVVDADMFTLYEHPEVAISVGANVARRLQAQVPGIRVMSPTRVAEWQFRTPLWSALPYGEMAESLGVERIVHIDLYEFRLNPPGNRWLWEGVCAANVGVIEPDGIDPDSFVDTWSELRISNTDFIRTTESRHRRAVNEILRRVSAKGQWAPRTTSSAARAPSWSK